ncbi:helix-turn-helix transcriptional regulator [Aliiroseovarius sediminis]|uniref:helix-turn-helix domain-containing protein n=1 Tax=Aliiroseovarius sediminis TaxID=2925839 RepID=UPI001F588F09|nr:helix-turn-helix transcriptional regulator [Aliiroseovarius sediminis]MCI2395599.1 helix-turn-helix domain-containing protein [Aliiroseovarius sediminis]
MKTTPKSPLRDIVARNMRKLRADRGWSQEFLAHETGLNRTYLSAVERSEQNISIDNLYRVAEGFGVEACTLLKA